MQNRENALKHWLEQTLGHSSFTLRALAGDASFRRYYRLNENGRTHIVMDAPPEKEPISPFIKIGTILAENEVLSPHIFAKNVTEGFLVLEDFGDHLLLKVLNSQNVDFYYIKAIEMLLKIQQCPSTEHGLPVFDESYMIEEMELFRFWFLQSYLGINLTPNEQQLITKTMDWLVEQIKEQPQVFIHRDYHSRNLMVMKDALGVIDFQDAMHGPISYDLVSLLKDCYISWPRTQVLQWVSYFFQNSNLSQNFTVDDFTQSFDLAGLQRHLKVLGIFSRLYLRDNKAAYLKNLPLTLHYVMECSELYPQLHPFLDFLNKKVALR